MKRSLEFIITLSSDNEYQIFLGRGCYLRSKSKTQLKRYLGVYKKVLNTNLNILSNLQIQFYELYRVNFLMFDAFISRKVKIKLHLFDDAFERLYNVNSCENQNTIQLNAVQVSFNLLFDLVDILKPFAQKSKNYILINQLQYLYKNLHLLETQFIKDKLNLNLTYDNVDSKLRIIHKSELLKRA